MSEKSAVSYGTVGERAYSTYVQLSPTKKTKPKKERTIVNPIFTELKDGTTDKFWANIFKNASYGKFPKGFSYSTGYQIGRAHV